MRIGDRLEIQPYEYGWKVSKIVDNDPTNKLTKNPTRKVTVGFYPSLDTALITAMDEWLRINTEDMQTAKQLLQAINQAKEEIIQARAKEDG